MDTFRAIASRRDERRYSDEPLGRPTVERILDAGRLAGSAGNRQPWAFVVPETPDRVEALAAAVYVPDNVRRAALVVAVVTSGKGPVAFDAGRAAQNMLLAAWDEGVASCPNGVADRDAARRAVDASDDETVAIVLTFGRADRRRDPEGRTPEEWSAGANRRPLTEIVRSVR